MYGSEKHPREPKWLYRDLKRMHERATDAVFARLGLRDFGQPLLLFVLENYSDSGQIPTQRELARDLNLSPTTITVSLKSLERQGCVRKLPDESDMRKNRIEITDRGREVARNCRIAFDEIDEGMYCGFSEEEISLISSFYIRMTDNLQKLTESEPRSQKEVPN